MFDHDGKPFFRPSTGRAPSEGDGSARVPRWESLYSLRNQAEEKRQQLKRQLEDEEQAARNMATRINPKSEKLLTGAAQQHRKTARVFTMCFISLKVTIMEYVSGKLAHWSVPPCEWVTQWSRLVLSRALPTVRAYCSVILESKLCCTFSKHFWGKSLDHKHLNIVRCHAGLLHRRFQQIFEYLYPTHGFLDLLAVRNMPQFETLSMEISDDVESAAVILCAERGLCQGPITARVLQSASERRVRILHAVTVLAERRLVGEESTDVDLAQFSELMEKAVRTNRIPTRTYLLPDIRAPSDTEENLTFKPEINVNSMELAHQRWQDWPRPVHEDLHQHAKTMQTRKEMRQKLKELELLSECTFQPELSSKSSFEQHRTLSAVSRQSGHSLVGDVSQMTSQAHRLPSGAKPHCHPCF